MAQYHNNEQQDSDDLLLTQYEQQVPQYHRSNVLENRRHALMS